MITALDSDVFFDLLIPHAPHGDQSEAALDAAWAAGAVVVSEPVYVEVAAWFSTEDDLTGFLRDSSITLLESGERALALAGAAFSAYSKRRPEGIECPSCGYRKLIECERCGRALRARQHVASDFIIGAHASVHADALLTRDQGFYQSNFPRLELL